MAVRPNHLGIALQRHRRAGRLENRDQRWVLPYSEEESEHSALIAWSDVGAADLVHDPGIALHEDLWALARAIGDGLGSITLSSADTELVHKIRLELPDAGQVLENITK
jgi:hypothetical protein